MDHCNNNNIKNCKISEKTLNTSKDSLINDDDILSKYEIYASTEQIYGVDKLVVTPCSGVTVNNPHMNTMQLQVNANGIALYTSEADFHYQTHVGFHDFQKGIQFSLITLGIDYGPNTVRSKIIMVADPFAPELFFELQDDNTLLQII